MYEKLNIDLVLDFRDDGCNFVDWISHDAVSQPLSPMDLPYL